MVYSSTLTHTYKHVCVCACVCVYTSREGGREGERNHFLLDKKNLFLKSEKGSNAGE